ncbi:biotin--[acetyl-CoA-carboxylase] ligase [Nostoc sp. MS1]|uniref:biotin--[acetyl-CoA-carboxylase] ligase n=1 Tax=Nostoc sp. MS1 TaxID=2764711 RepID=UPI001CC75757|nr:biotin--[acetyl-CoA-carboxylase] ligase [Nostoc sp. MS1]BCL36059.1 biotin--[acetyl-CoA-carboxylase] ligase [Nostoc sp. MS1]
MAVEFNQQKLESALQNGRKFVYLPFSLHIFSSVASTNRTLWELIDQGADAGSVVIATQQTAGRGQWGRQWVSPTGGLYVSVAIAPKIAANTSYQLTLASAWGIASQLRQAGVDVGIKWPNDLVLEGRKLGGILTETKIKFGHISQAVVGVGINWANPVPETGINLESWQAQQVDKPISCLETLTSKVLLGIESGLACLFQEGIDILLSRYCELLVNMGDRVHVNELWGVVVGVTPQGDLRVALQTDGLTDIKTSELSLEPGTINLGYRRSLGTY